MRRVGVGLLCGLWLSSAVVLAAETPAATWDMAGFAAAVKPLAHPLGGRMPMMAWNLPLPRGDKLVAMRADGSLRQALGILVERGLVPTVELGWEWTPAGAMAMAQTLQEAGQPVNILLPRVDLIEGTAYADCPIQAEGPDATRANQNRQWPCLWLAKPEKTTAWLQEQLRPFKDAGIKVAGLWFDDECLPHPWNGCYEAQRSNPACRAAYPPEIIGDWGAFKPWANQLKTDLFSRGAAPLRDWFPGLKLGNYGDVYAATSDKYAMDANMASLYAWNVSLPGAFKDKDLTQAAADDYYFRGLIAVFSATSRGQRPGKLNIPYVSRLVPDNADPKYRYGMSQEPYRELLRHLFLRGATSLYLFNLGYPGSPVTTAESFASVEDARVVLDEMLGQRGFFDQGRPLNFEAVDAEGVLWSGLRLPQTALVRTWKLTAGPAAELRIALYGREVKLSADPAGAWYLVARDGSVKRLP